MVEEEGREGGRKGGRKTEDEMEPVHVGKCNSHFHILLMASQRASPKLGQSKTPIIG